jgi:hypothetical protein
MPRKKSQQTFFVLEFFIKNVIFSMLLMISVTCFFKANLQGLRAGKPPSPSPSQCCAGGGVL